MEHDDVVDPVDELRPEGPLQLVHDLFLHALMRRLLSLREEAGRRPLADEARAEVRGHDEDGVLEVHHVAHGIGEAAVVEDLQEHVEDVRMGLLDLVEEHYGIRATPHLLGQESALFVADIAGRSSEEPGHGELLHVLRHVHPDESVLVPEQVLGEGARELCLAHAGRAEEHE
jgi:hypothetical protein